MTCPYRVPYLQFDVLVLDGEGLAAELHSDGCVVVQFKLSVEEL